MSRSTDLKPGVYRVEITIVRDFLVEHGELKSENDALDWCREGGECIDWEVERIGPVKDD